MDGDFFETIRIPVMTRMLEMAGIVPFEKYRNQLRISGFSRILVFSFAIERGFCNFALR